MCGRPTKAGTPCRQFQNYMWGKAGGSPCRQHTTDGEREIVKEKNEIFRAGWDEGWAAGAETLQWEKEQYAKLKEKLAKYQKRERAARMRFTDSRGNQLVTVDHRLGYAWRGPGELAVGDRVTVPGTWFSPVARTAVVTGLGSDYDGEFVFIAGRASEARV